MAADPVILHDRHLIKWDSGYWYNKSTLFNIIAAHRYPHRYAEFMGQGGQCLDFWLKGCSQEEHKAIKDAVLPILDKLK